MTNASFILDLDVTNNKTVNASEFQMAGVPVGFTLFWLRERQVFWLRLYVDDGVKYAGVVLPNEIIPIPGAFQSESVGRDITFLLFAGENAENAVKPSDFTNAKVLIRKWDQGLS